MKEYVINEQFDLEKGGSLPQLRIAYHTFGNLNSAKSNVVWICHALTANSDVRSWWPGLVGEGKIIDPGKYFIVCANIIGSCYGTTGPLSTDPDTGDHYLHQFPAVTVRDMVKAHTLLRKQLGINHIQLLVGGSLGGYQALEWAVSEPNVIQNLFLLTTSATESAWGIAIHQAQRMALEADRSFVEGNAYGGAAGVKAARAIGIITYRNYEIMVEKQTDPDPEKTDGLKAASYMIHQGNKLAERFNAYSYFTLSKAMDTHHLGRGRGGNVDDVLSKIIQPTLLIGISSDLLCPPQEQRHISQKLPNCTYIEIDSVYGHDGFLVESDKIEVYLKEFLHQRGI